MNVTWGHHISDRLPRLGKTEKDGVRHDHRPAGGQRSQGRARTANSRRANRRVSDAEEAEATETRVS